MKLSQFIKRCERKHTNRNTTIWVESEQCSYYVCSDCAHTYRMVMIASEFAEEMKTKPWRETSNRY